MLKLPEGAVFVEGAVGCVKYLDQDGDVCYATFIDKNLGIADAYGMSQLLFDDVGARFYE